MAQPLSPPYAVWNSTDHSGPIIIVTTLCTLYWLVAGLMQQSFSLARGIRYTWADSFFTASMITGFTQSTLVLVACHHGIGKSANILHPIELETARRAYQASNILYAVSLGLVKCSAAFFVANLTVRNVGSLRHVPPAQRWTLCGVLGCTTLWTIASAVVLGLSCAHASTAVCIGTTDRWVGIFMGDAITDLLIAAFAASVILRTKASINRRIVWYIPFCVRICIPLWAGLRLLSIDTAKSTHDPTIALWLFIALTEVQIMIALLSTASPALRQTLLELATQYGAAADSLSGSRRGGSFGMKHLRSKRSEGHSGHSGRSKPRLLPFPGSAVGNLRFSRSKADADNTGDADSQDGIIRQVEFEVRYDTSEASDRERDLGDSYGRT